MLHTRRTRMNQLAICAQMVAITATFILALMGMALL